MYIVLSTSASFFGFIQLGLEIAKLQEFGGSVGGRNAATFILRLELV